MEGRPADCLRHRAPRWSLAGDAELLAALQAVHQRVLQRCAEGEAALRALGAAQRDAALALRNVSGRLQALSNTQFVESRVYDDDVAAPPAPAPASAPAAPAQPQHAAPPPGVLVGLRALERCHECVRVLCDSDSDGGGSEGSDGGGGREVLRPRERYAHRPLPYVVGSRGWRSKWHAGLLAEDSDSDSGASLSRGEGVEQYSPSESEGGGEESPAAESPEPPPRAAPAPAASVAAALAARLAAHAQAQPRAAPPPGPAPPPPGPAPPPPGVVFPDSPPSAPASPSRSSTPSVGEESPPEDIFAELRRDASRPRPHPRARDEEEEGGIFSDVIDTGPKKPTGARSVFGAGVCAESVAAALQRRLRARDTPDTPDTPDMRHTRDTSYTRDAPDTWDSPDTRSKQLTDDIHDVRDVNAPRDTRDGRAPQRQQRHATTDDNTGRRQATRGEQHDASQINKASAIKAEKDIFDDLFAKSEKLQKNTKTVESKDPKREEKKVDLFSDNIFDDIDDIFNSNVVTKVPVKVAHTEHIKSLFDDDDDLFSDISVTATNKQVTNTIAKVAKSSIFDSNDELFSEKPPVITKSVNLNEPVVEVNKPLEVVKPKFSKEDDKVSISDANREKAKVLFGDDDDNDIFNDKPSLAIKTSQSIIEDKTVNRDIRDKSINVIKKSESIFDDEDELFMEKTSEKIDVQKIPQKQIEETSKMTEEKKSIFDDSDDDIFSNMKLPPPAQKPTEIQDNKTEKVSSKINSQIPQVISSQVVEENIDNTGFFEDDVGLFANTKADAVSKTQEMPKVNVSKQTDEPTCNKDVIKPKHAITSPNLFEDDDYIDNLFVKSNSRNEKPSIAPENDYNIFNSENSTVNAAETDKLASIINTSIKDKDQVAPEAIKSSETTTSVVEPEPESSNLSDQGLDQDIFGTPVEKVEDRKLSQQKVVDNALVANYTENDTNIQVDISVDEDDVLFDSTNKANTSSVKPNIAHKPDLQTSKKDSDEPIIEARTEVLENVIEENSFIFGDKSDNLLDKEAGIMNKDYKLSTEGDIRDAIEKKLDKNKDLHTKEVDSNKNITQLESNIPDLFSDVFDDLPPAFEKPKEPKKSKNINALFDDDSDDETLFFKKNDVILDEKPEDFSSVSNKDIFGIFHDEPPAIDVDFVHKPSQNSGLNDKLDITDDKAVDVASKSVKSQNFNRHEVTPRTDSDEDLIKSETETKPPRTVSPRPVDKPDGVSTETKKIGKLKPMNFQINVNSLLPGASPKKAQRAHEQTDGQVITKSNEELHTDTANDGETDYKLVKSVSFEGGPESPILDNKLSKERVKIQVKRRPSTRRARKAALNLGDDSTDNSSSIDDAPKVKARTDDIGHNIKDDNVRDKKILDKAFDNKQSNYKDISAKAENVEHEEGKRSELNREYKKEDEGNKEQSSPKESPSKDVTSKVVYILNDEDIFSNTKPVESPTSGEPKASNTESGVKPAAGVKPKVLKIVDDDEAIFKTTAPPSEKAIEQTETIKTLGKAYPNHSEVLKVAAKPNIFDDDDGDIFKDFAKVETTPKPIKPTERKTRQSEPKPAANRVENTPKPKASLFDLSDEESELFGARRDFTADRSALFGSDSDEDLFSVKSRGKKTESAAEDTEGAKTDAEAAKKRTEGSKNEARKVEVKATLLDAKDGSSAAHGLAAKDTGAKTDAEAAKNVTSGVKKRTEGTKKEARRVEVTLLDATDAARGLDPLSALSAGTP